MKTPILTVRKLSRHFIIKKNIFSKKKIINAVKDVSFDIFQEESLGLVGESGSGKSTIGNLILRLLESNEGKISFNGIEISGLGETELRTIRKDIQKL